ncbi:MAG: SMP-30/gluconolactonase/LRE family protein [Hyphomicrobiales bacterium]|nr:SMP-30/gluconolactonase/LRE family protein [Hyphomicrobiales bacterium]
MTTAQSVIDCRCTLGEGIFWDERSSQLWWTDVPMPSRLFRFDLERQELDSWSMDEMVISVIGTEDTSKYLIASHGGLNLFDPGNPGLARILAPEPMMPFNRSNDAAADPQGRLWLGTMQNNIAPDGGGIDIAANSGTLFRIDPDLSVHPMESGIGIANTVCWSPDQRTMYFADTLSGAICAYDFDPAAGRISNKREFARFDRGVPDGSTVDADGFLWNARWDGSCVARFAPDGSVDRVVEVPVAQVTNCAFGGKDLSTLFITTARYDLGPEQLEDTPNAGSIFAVETGVTGMADNRFHGTTGQTFGLRR